MARLLIALLLVLGTWPLRAQHIVGPGLAGGGDKGLYVDFDEAMLRYDLTQADRVVAVEVRSERASARVDEDRAVVCKFTALVGTVVKGTDKEGDGIEVSAVFHNLGPLESLLLTHAKGTRLVLFLSAQGDVVGLRRHSPALIRELRKISQEGAEHDRNRQVDGP